MFYPKSQGSAIATCRGWLVLWRLLQKRRRRRVCTWRRRQREEGLSGEGGAQVGTGLLLCGEGLVDDAPMPKNSWVTPVKAG